jgi:hypothetical protein
LLQDQTQDGKGAFHRGQKKCPREQLQVDSRRAAFAAWTEGAQVIKGVDARAVAIVPTHFDGVVSNRADSYQFRIGRIDKPSLRPVPLAKSARTVSAKINFIVLADMPVVPGDAHGAVRFDVVDLGWVRICHRPVQKLDDLNILFLAAIGRKGKVIDVFPPCRSLGSVFLVSTRAVSVNPCATMAGAEDWGGQPFGASLVDRSVWAHRHEAAPPGRVLGFCPADGAMTLPYSGRMRQTATRSPYVFATSCFFLLQISSAAMA